MRVDDNHLAPKPHGGRAWRRIWRSPDGAAAIEFAILAIPYFMIIFAIIETFVAFTAEQLVSNAVENVSRQLRTGQITNIAGRDSYKTEPQFRKIFCDEVSILIRCSDEELATPKLLYLDVRTFATFAQIPTTIPRMSTDPYADINPASFRYAPGGPKSINMVRAYYRWQVITDLVRPYITNIRPGNGVMPSDFLIIGTAAFQNEDYP